jgi:NAD(P)-dependent dehydrogenase (short-subunit alcohol dehydrogenase family)
MNIPHEDGLEGKVAIVTGAGARNDGIGNGRAAAILLAASGVHVLCVDRDLGLAERTVAMIEEAGHSALPFAADVTQAANCEAMVEAALAHWGRLDVLDNNVGIGSRGSVVDEDFERWQRVMTVNVDSMFLSCKAAIPAMRAAGSGAIINIASISALRPRGLTTYSTSKSAVIGLTKAMAVDHGGEGIRVNCVAPGPVYTPMVAGAGMSDEARARRASASVLGIEGTGWDVGHAVRFLASAHARYITGQVLVVDGGTTLRGPARDNR